MTLELEGRCPVCEADVTFRSENDWYRDFLLCDGCVSLVRERALAMILDELRPDWRSLRIHESSPADRGVSAKLAREAPGYIASQYFAAEPLGSMVGRFRNENLEKQTFEDGSLDVVISLDVMEHVFDPAAAYREIHRTLVPGGMYLHTFPIQKYCTESHVARARLREDGSVEHLVEQPEYHGNPISDQGVLVTFDYGYDVVRAIAEWAPFDVRVTRFWDRTHAVMGDFTEVVVCRKRG